MVKMFWKHTPKHEVLTDTQAKRQLKLLSMTFEELPLIKYSDAALKKLREEGVETPLDSVVRISRNSITYGENAFYYRRVIP